MKEFLTILDDFNTIIEHLQHSVFILFFFIMFIWHLIRFFRGRKPQDVGAVLLIIVLTSLYASSYVVITFAFLKLVFILTYWIDQLAKKATSYQLSWVTSR